MSAELAPVVPLPIPEAQQRPEAAHGRVVTVLAPKGGLGKTTLAANLATGLARVAPESVVIVDADLQFGDVANVLDLTPTHTIRDFVTDELADDDLVLKTLLTRHGAGLYAACGAASPVAAEGVAPVQLGSLVRRLAGVFDWVVVDTTPALGEHTLAVLDEATDAIAVTGLTVPNLRSLRTELGVLASVGFAPASLRVVVNHAVDAGGLTVKDAESILERRVDHVVPRSRSVAVSTNRGVPLLVDAPRDPAAKAITRLLAALTGHDPKSFTRTRRTA